MRRFFSVGAKMLSMKEPELVDTAGDLYSAFGWAYAIGKGRPSSNYTAPKRVFSNCAGAALYRKAHLEQIGGFDELHFAYLEDVDIGYRAQIFGLKKCHRAGCSRLSRGGAVLLVRGTMRLR